MRRCAAALGASIAALSPSLSLACPACATRARGGAGSTIALGLMILLPFVVVGIVTFIIRSERRPELTARSEAE